MTGSPTGAPTVALVTLGCAKNDADSRAMSALLAEQGFVACEDPTSADFIVLNTCAFIEAAIEESLDTILELAALDRVRSGESRLLVAGCLPSRFGSELSDELPEVAAFVPVAEEAGLVEALNRLIEQDGDVDRSTACEGAHREALAPVEPFGQPWAYVKISDGCSRHCSYCTIPAIRGSYRNYPFSQIDSEVSELVARGAREIVLIGQDTGIWSESSKGHTRPVPQNLAQLLDMLAEKHSQTWFRVMYLQPEGITDELLGAMAAHTNIARYLDVPLQHASRPVLEAMNRRGSGAEYLRMVGHVRKMLPGVVLRTTVMTGFPGERQEDFDELYGFLEAARFDYVGIFAYSREAGTTAAELPGQVDRETALDRARELRELTDGIGFERAQEQVGKEVDVLVQGRDEEGLFGRTQGQAPEVDGLTYLIVTGEGGEATMSGTSEGVERAAMLKTSEEDRRAVVPGKTEGGAQAETSEMLEEGGGEAMPAVSEGGGRAVRPEITEEPEPFVLTLEPHTFVRARIAEAILYDLFAEVL